MRLFILLGIVFLTISNPAMTQQHYDKQWKKVTDLDEKGRPQSALEAVNEIYNLALKDKNEIQQVKALIFRLKYTAAATEDGALNNLREVDKQIQQASGPQQALLQSMKGEMLWSYLQANRYRLYNSTTISNDTTTDISTWSIDRFTGETSRAYLASLAHPQQLQQEKLEKYEPVLTQGKNTRQLRPTLYDLLAHRAISYFKTGESNIRQPANQFELTDTVAFAPAPAFAAHRFTTTDSAALQFKALALLQELIRFHKADPAALLDVDLERISFVNQVALMPDKDEQYIQAMQQMQETYAAQPEVTRVLHMLAQHYYQQGLQQDPAADTAAAANALARVKALCEEAIRKAPQTPGAMNCAALLENLQQQQLRLETERVNLPGQPFRTLVTYQNVNRIHLRLARIDENFMKALRVAQSDYRDTGNRYWKLLLARKPLKAWEQPFTGAADYREHATEIKMDALPTGAYMILASASADFSLADNPLAVQFIHVSRLSHIANRNDYYALDRQTGQPLAGVTVKVWESQQPGDPVLTHTGVTDKAGAISLPFSKKNASVRLQWISKEDTLFLEDQNYYTYTNRDNKQLLKPVTFLFTDRAIYRPGQTVYFKGIVVKKQAEAGNSTVQENFKTRVSLFSMIGNERVDSIAVQTNEYGSYSGHFRLPEGRLNGVYSIQDKETNGRAQFSVEEYKRPKFYVEFDTLKGTYRLGDTVHINGKALAYAGSNIDGAKVKYRVKRRANYPYPWLFRTAVPYSEPREIIQGETQTDASGAFNIHFPALPDKSVKPSLKPVFTYIIEADVTDLNGETRNGQQQVRAGYQALEVTVKLPEKLQQQALQKLTVSTRNLNGVFEPVQATLAIKPLMHPGRLLRPRYWRKPDVFVIPREQYEKDFPLDIYSDENLPATWQQGSAALQQQWQTREDGSVQLPSQKLKPGWYELEVNAADKYGQPVTQKAVFELVDSTARTLPYPAYVWQYTPDASFEPGQQVTSLLGTTVQEAQVLKAVQRIDEKPGHSFFTLPASITEEQYTVTEKDRGNVYITYTFVKDNRVFSASRQITVPWSNKQLELSIATHRDKLLPGEKEKWQLQVKGYKGRQATAELVAAMYDASLDAFRPHNWALPNLYPILYGNTAWGGADNFREETSNNFYNPRMPKERPQRPFSYDELNWFGWEGRNFTAALAGQAAGLNESVIVGYGQPKQRIMLRGRQTDAAAMKVSMPAAPPGAKMMVEGDTAAEQEEAAAPAPPEQNIQPRKNFNETAFFFPDLRTDKEGNVTFEFTVPEALTRWRFLGLAHTKDLSFGQAETNIVTQKPLMVLPNAPRFLREGDRMEFSAKISNLADSALTGQARLELLDAATGQPVDGWFQNVFPAQHFTVQKGQSTLVTFPLQIPYSFNSALQYRIVAQAGRYSDGEENALPVLTNSMLVTETLPLALRGDGTRTFSFDKLLHSDTSETLRQHALTVEFTGNPAWYAVQALPYLMEYPHQCAEQVFNRYYANALASHIATTVPGIKGIFEQWAKKDTAALQSNLQKNEELKSVLLQQTPWVLEAKNEAEQKARIALLFDLHRMSGELEIALAQLQKLQLPSGAFPWFMGMWEDRFITQYIVTGLGRLSQLGVLTAKQQQDMYSLMSKALAWLDQRIDQDYHQLLKSKADMKKPHIGSIQLHYLYMRSLLKDKPLPDTYKQAYDYYLSQAKTAWLQQPRFEQAMAALALHRSGDHTTPTDILRSLKEHAIQSEEMGMYWKSERGYWWYQAPIEAQAMLIEAFEVAGKDTAAVDAMKTWLLKNKQTNNWHTTKATADACYAMLLQGSNWLRANPQVVIQLGSETIRTDNRTTEAGTGYFKERLEAKAVKPAMGRIQVSVQNSQGQPAWGAVYWQYFEQLDKITPAQTPLSLQKQLFIQRDSEKGPVLTAITEDNQLKIGDKVKVRIVLRADRTMEYLHLRDMRAACFEPQNVISTSKWQNGLSYYESTKDASTDFFFSYLPKGTHVFEYTLFVTHEGRFSNGISIAECMYAPEFSAHSEGVNVNVVK